MKCACRLCGAALHSIHAPNSRQRSSAPYRVMKGANLRARCERGETVNVSMQTEVDTGWRKTPLLVAELSPLAGEADEPFVLFSAITTHGTTASWTMAAPMRRCLRLRACLPLIAANGGGGFVSASGRATRMGAIQVRHGMRMSIGTSWSSAASPTSTWTSTGGEGASVLTNSGVVDELKAVGLRGDRSHHGSETCRATPWAGCRPVVLGHRHSFDVRQSQPSTARTRENADGPGMVVAHPA